ncbi:MAG TPA: methionyl-tRNA formyltransferase [Candidatus Magasanikbacteria bacterium]|nr:methionyl-tRNA formyltransferase [Candidatus Magasanikbacteria bacterium]
MNKTPIIFFGSHNFAARILQTLIDSDNFEIKLVITQPDRPVGRKKILESTPVKVLANANFLQVIDPESLRKTKIELPDAEVAICAQYGLIIPQYVLDAPQRGIINVHTSLLPKYRGASPIQSALMNGETQTGVTIMLMNAGLDTGPILKQKTVAIEPNDTYLTLEKKLVEAGSKLIIPTTLEYLADTIKPIPQSDTEMTTCRELTRDDGRINWQTMRATQIFNLWRGLTPWPGVWTTWQGKRLKLLEIAPTTHAGIIAGQILIENDRVFVGAMNESCIELQTIQLEGKNATSARDFIRGARDFNGSKLK